MASRSLKRVVVLFDLAIEPPEDHDYSFLFKEISFESERAVFESLKRLGVEPILLAVHNDLFRLTRDLKRLEPDLIFNLTESFGNRRDRAPALAGLLELMDIPYTGTQALGLGLSQDKGLAKKILSHHRVRVPRGLISSQKRPLKSVKGIKFPAFVKLAREEASEGIAKDSFVENEKDALDRIQFLHSKYEDDVIVEEFIEGRELYVSVIGRKRLEVLPPREISFGEYPEDEPRFATYKVKWDEQYRKRWGIRNAFAKALTPEHFEQIESLAKRSFEALQLAGFARFDFRLAENDEIVLLEANPNPSLSPWDDFARSAQKAGYSFDEIVAKIMDLALYPA